MACSWGVLFGVSTMDPFGGHYYRRLLLHTHSRILVPRVCAHAIGRVPNKPGASQEQAPKLTHIR